MDASAVDLYQTLGVPRTATAGEIKTAYHRLARAYHPDATGGDLAKERRFREVSAAYAVLGDTDRRKDYDRVRDGTRGVGIAGVAVGGVDFGDWMDQFFGGEPDDSYVEHAPAPQPRRRARRRGARASAKSGAPAPGEGSRSVGGPFRVDGADVHSDVQIWVDQAILGASVTVATLDGPAEVKVPPGTSSGTKLRLRGRGERGASGGRGDHYLTVQIRVPRDPDEEREVLAFLASRVRR